MITNQQMEIALGLPIYIEGFKDGKPRKAYPFTLKNLLDANLYLSSFDNENLYVNFKDQNATLAMASFFKTCFRVENENELQELLENIDGDNFSEIVSDIKTISGISDNKGDIDIDKTSKTMDWNVAVNCIPLYTSIPITMVGDMTLIQFNKTLELIGKNINFEYKTRTIGMTKEPNKYIKENEHPLYSQSEVKSTRLTMKDIAGFM